MQNYIIRRIVQGIFVLILLTLIVFLLIRLLPVDPLYIWYSAGELATLDEEDIAALRAKHGLDENLLVQYGKWMGHVLRGDLGRSVISHRHVVDLLGERLAVTANLAIPAMIISTVLGVFLGVIAAVKRGKWADLVATLAANLAITIPVFWLGIIMILVFAVNLDILPVAGYVSPFDDFWQNIQYMVMPVFCMMVASMGGTARLARTTMLEVIRREYITTARSKGLRQRDIIIRHALKNGLIPVVTVMGFKVTFMFGGAVLVEQVFAIPGIGRLMVNAVHNFDYAVVQGGVIVIGAIIVLTNLIIDISYGWFDPRVRYD